MLSLRKAFLAVSVLLIVSLGCNDSDPVNPEILLTSQSSLKGLWRGGFTNGAFVIDAIGDFPQDQIFNDMTCTLILNESQFDLTMESKVENTPTTYFQTGTWSWDEDDPTRLQFVVDSIAVEQRYPSTYQGLTSVAPYDTLNFKWSCGLEILSDDYHSMKLTGFQIEHWLGEWPDTAVVMFVRYASY